MRLKTLAKWSVLPALIAVVWISSQAFKDVAQSMNLSYKLETTTFNSVVNILDTVKLSTFDKINTMVYTENTQNVASFGSDGAFSIQITHLAPPKLGGKELPLNNVSTVTVDQTGIKTNNEGPYPFEPGEYQAMVATAKQLALMTTNCSSNGSDIVAMADQFKRTGAKTTTQGRFTVFQVGNVETVLDLTSKLFISEIIKENGKLVSDVYYEYTNTGSSNPGSDSPCSVLKRITSRRAFKTTAGVPMYNVAKYELSDIRVASSGK